MESIICKGDYCYICGNPQTEVHHVMHGVANRKLADKYGLTVRLCPDHHRGSKNGVHFNRELDIHLKQLAQAKFEKIYSHEEWMQIFNKNYL